ncbi:MAG: SET domain-containing histone-lysine N-methyltransferase [archaeon]|nr:SET domain-containing histone-lysine N-methyltransferase [archaeon]
MTEKEFKEASVLFEEKDFESALRKINQCDSNSFDVSLLKTKILFELNELSMALEEVNKCIKLNKDKAESYEMKEKIFYEMTNLEEAENALKELKDYAPKDSSYDAGKISQLEEQLEKRKGEIAELRKQYPGAYDDYLNYLKILYKGGAFFKNIELKFHSLSYRSAITTKPLHKGDIFMRMPPNLFISLEDAKECPLGKEIISHGLDKKLNSPHHTLLASFLLSEIEKGEQSKWAFYFKLLPQSLDNFPIFFTPKEMDLLKGSHFKATLDERMNDMDQDYKMLCDKIPEYKKYNYEDFRKYRMLVGSRIFGVTINDISTDIIVPYADMLNHKEPRETHWTFNQKKNAFMVDAEMEIDTGKEVFYSYGRKCNSRFFLNYGFTIENNPDNEYPLKIYIPKQYKFNSEVNYKKFTLKRKMNEKDFPSMLTFLRHMANNEEYKKVKDSLSKSSSPLSNANETEVLNFLKTTCEDLDKAYPGTLQEDYEIAKKKDNISFNEFNCAIMRISEREILKFIIDLADAGLSLLKCSRTEFNDKLKELNNDSKNKEFSKYLAELKNVSQ